MTTTVSRVLKYSTRPNELVATQDRDLSGRVAIVSGASHGIGRCVALSLAQHGASVAVSYFRSPDEAESVSEAIRSFGVEVLPICADIGDEHATGQMVNEVIEEFGRVDILVNNAGVNHDAYFHQMSHEAWDEVLRINLTGVFNLTRAIINPMRQRGYGRIINIASVVGLAGNAGQANYAAAKSALLGLTKTLALENADCRITVNAVAPGFIETRATQTIPDTVREEILARIPLGRLGRPEEVARLVGFLAGEHAEYITGQVIGVNGGLYM
ncbi:3-oxoacyl-ACP reductase family protein [Candidatus Zixiibacteriota bacterium]